MSSSRGALLVERLGIESLGRESHNIKAACIACDSSDAFRVHQDSGIAYCHACKRKWSRLHLAEQVLGDREAAWNLLIELGLEEPRQTYNHSGAKTDVIELIARAKHVKAEALQSYGATIDGRKVVFPVYGPDGQQCSTFTISSVTDKGRLAKGKKSGLFFPHVDGAVRLPQPGEMWLVPEGVKDAAALFDMGHLACGLNGSSLAPKFARLFANVDVMLVPDRDTAGIAGADKSARALLGHAASIRIAHLQAEVKDSGGEDVRDILRRENGSQLVKQAIADAVGWKLASDANSDRAFDRQLDHVVTHVSDYGKIPNIFLTPGQTDKANARRYVALHGDSVRWCDQWSKWLVWDGSRWAPDVTLAAQKRAKTVSLRLFAEIGVNENG